MKYFGIYLIYALKQFCSRSESYTKTHSQQKPSRISSGILLGASHPSNCWVSRNIRGESRIALSLWFIVVTRDEKREATH